MSAENTRYPLEGVGPCQGEYWVPFGRGGPMPFGRPGPMLGGNTGYPLEGVGPCQQRIPDTLWKAWAHARGGIPDTLWKGWAHVSQGIQSDITN
jgi:hypothetical protein